MRGVEPPRPCEHYHLKVACIPFHHIRPFQNAKHFDYIRLNHLRAQENSYFELLLTYCNKLMEAYQAQADNVDAQ